MTTEDKLKEFFRWLMQQVWEGTLSPEDIQDKAHKMGLLIETEFDPEKHGDATFADLCEPGDPWFELAPEVKA